jgi:hypothetical protein
VQRKSTCLVEHLRKTPLERDEQAAFFTWLSMLGFQGERVSDYAYAIPNGTFLAGGVAHRAIQARKLKEQGLRPGYPDINIDLPAHGYHGLRIEMKRIKGPKPSEKQVEWHARLRKVGYCVRVCYGFEEARRATAEYFKGG